MWVWYLPWEGPDRGLSWGVFICAGREWPKRTIVMEWRLRVSGTIAMAILWGACISLSLSLMNLPSNGAWFLGVFTLLGEFVIYPAIIRKLWS